MHSGTYTQIRAAIANKKQVTAIYDDQRREMCPHAIGRGPLGNEQALFYQFAGTSSRGDIANLPEVERWRCMALEKLSDIEVRDGDWHTSDNHSVPSSCLVTIDLEVDH